MANPRATVLGIVFSMLLLASIFTINSEGAVDATAWALLGLTAAFAAATVIAFFAEDDNIGIENHAVTGAVNHTETESQPLPDPVDSGFDVPIL